MFVCPNKYVGSLLLVLGLELRAWFIEHSSNSQTITSLEYISRTDL